MLDNKKRARWKRTFTPGGESIWTSTIGDVAFANTEDRDGDVNILTLEERLDGPVDSEANLRRALLMRSLYVGNQSDISEDDQVGEFVRFAHGFCQLSRMKKMEFQLHQLHLWTQRLWMRVVPAMKPSDDPRANADGFMVKSRICACGNFEVEDWTLGGLDVEAAFLNAEISGNRVIITPPKIMRDLGIIAENTVWVAERNIYGLRRGPTEWERERDHKLNHAELPPGDGDKLGALHLVPLNLAAGLWKIVDGAGVTRGACCAYVDDGLIVGGIEVIRRDPVVSETLTLKLVQCMRFLGAEISVASDGLRIGQAKYVAQELRARGWLALKGAESLPVPSEGLQGSDIRDNAFENNMKLAQKEAGTLMWIALRSRPDIAACLGVASTLITSRPSESLRLCKGIWRYLRSTWNKTLHYRYGGGPVSPGGSDVAADAEWTFRIVSDASLAPGGARSRSGMALFLGDHLVYWRSQRQSIVAWSATESEIEATAAAIQEGIKIHAGLEELLACKIHIIANGDNAGAIHLITRERFHEQTMRTRHFAIRCAYIRDLVWLHSIEVQHRGTTELKADGLTKVLGKAKLAVARTQLRIT
ncbi:RE1 [Symbiodinium sp. CCMP2592]|nr:RE1 [Symbiodinium sp. CCMP2592]